MTFPHDSYRRRQALPPAASSGTVSPASLPARRAALPFQYCFNAALVLAGALLLAATGRAGEAGQKLALVNVSLVFEKYDKVPEVQRAIDANHEAQKNELQQRAKDLVQRNKDLEALYSRAQTDEKVFDMVQQLRKEQFHYEHDLATLNAQIRKEYTKQMREVLSDIRVAVRALAEEGGFELVLRSPDSDDPPVSEATPESPANPAESESKTELAKIAPRTTGELVERFNRNPVLFGAKTVDITQETLKKLNEDYRRRSGKPKNQNPKP
ncbi:MAG: OmpH family outer membrane protein [Planctomycetota bacterium]